MSEAPAIQPIGFHLGLSSDWRVSAISANVGDFLPASADAILGHPVTDLFSETAIHDIRNRMTLLPGAGTTEHLFKIALVDGGSPFDMSIRRNDDGFGIDAERSGRHGFGDAVGVIEGMLARIDDGDDFTRLAEQAARQTRALTGFDQVSIWTRTGLTAFSARPALSPPALAPGFDDFMVVDLDAASVALRFDLDRHSNTPRSVLREPAVEERHWLKESGAKAAMILPLATGGEIWGAVCCLHHSPRHVSVERRSIARLFARILALQIIAVELRVGRSGA